MRHPRYHRDREPVRSARDDREAGVSVVEVVLLAPLIILFIFVLVSFGELVDARGTVQGAARDAARAGSLQRDQGSAYNAAVAAARQDLGGLCDGAPNVTQSGNFAAGQLYTVQVSCDVRLDWINMGTHTITSSSTAPLDTYRRAG